MATTVEQHLRSARLFLGLARVEVGSLTAADVHRFVERECPSRSVAVAKTLVSCTRSFLRFLFAAGWTAVDLSSAVPPVAAWQGTVLPKALAPEALAALLASCDRNTAGGRRDYAVLVLLSRLGLRAGEVAGLCLEDIDWDAGEITVTGKGSRVERLRSRPMWVRPLSTIWLTADARQRTGTFSRLAPHGPMTRSSVKGVVRLGCDR